MHATGFLTVSDKVYLDNWVCASDDVYQGNFFLTVSD